MEIWSKCDICGRDIPVGELCYGLKKGNCICKNCCTGFENCTFTLAPMPTLTQPNEWVSVEERLPEESDGMVLFTNGRAVTSGYRNHMFRMSDEEGVYAPAIRKGGGYMRVTHWMHLPAPPDRRPPEGEEDI